ncbi:FecCD family ABC transporter permease [Pelobacter propionicus]|uniref:Transport system permease protein n=1 Tax=Pelobacter propionicus (strain DSM 2379 / NBRC 103807 / OttBd1) TaxID=338966 RepID=A1ANB5_PELPD|nr:iron ABC transporter permease [Pelobacter propionicus]ABK98835.1 transport system permease protein [Pelobacter propionicus DSM 2379]
MVKKDYFIIALLMALVVAGGLLSLSSGSWSIPASHVVMIVLSKLGLYAGAISDVEASIVWDGRLPRFLVAFLVGFSLGGAGTIMQGIFKNPMASPGVMGIDAGAALGAVLAIYLGLASYSLVALPCAAIVFSLLTLVMVFAIATSGGRTSVSTLLLAGIALSLVFGALTSFVITLSTAEFDVGRVIVNWLMGDLNNRSWEHVAIVIPTTLVALLGTLFFARDLNLLMLGEETAANLGVNIRRARNGLLLFSSIETGGAIAVSGVIGFVGLVAPHIMRSLTGPDNRKLIFSSGLLAAVFIIYADLFVRLIVTVDLKVGIITSMLGGPFFLYLIVKHRKQFEYM